MISQSNPGGEVDLHPTAGLAVYPAGPIVAPCGGAGYDLSALTALGDLVFSLALYTYYLRTCGAVSSSTARVWLR